MSTHKRTYQWLFGGLGTAVIIFFLTWFFNRPPKPAIINTSSGNSQVASGSGSTQRRSENTQTASGGGNTQVANGTGTQTVNVYQNTPPPESASPPENKKPQADKPKPKVQHPVEPPAQSGNTISPNGSINQSSTGPNSPNIVANGNVTIGNIPSPDRTITVKRADLAVPILKKSVGKVRVDTWGATGNDEITKFSGQINTLFTMGNWQVLEGFANGIEILSTSTGISHGEGVRCYAKDANSLAAKAAMNALEIVGFPCQEGAAPFVVPGEASPDFYIAVGTRLSSQ